MFESDRMLRFPFARRTLTVDVGRRRSICRRAHALSLLRFAFGTHTLDVRLRLADMLLLALRARTLHDAFARVGEPHDPASDALGFALVDVVHGSDREFRLDDVRGQEPVHRAIAGSGLEGRDSWTRRSRPLRYSRRLRSLRSGWLRRVLWRTSAAAH